MAIAKLGADFNQSDSSSTSTNVSGTRPNPQFLSWLFRIFGSREFPQLQIPQGSLFGFNFPSFSIDGYSPFGAYPPSQQQNPGSIMPTLPGGGVGQPNLPGPAPGQKTSNIYDVAGKTGTDFYTMPYTPYGYPTGGYPSGGYPYGYNPNQSLQQPERPQSPSTSGLVGPDGQRRYFINDVIFHYPRDKAGDVYRVFDKAGLDPTKAYSIEELNTAFDKGGDWSGTSKGYWGNAIANLTAQGQLLDQTNLGQQKSAYWPSPQGNASGLDPAEIVRRLMTPTQLPPGLYSPLGIGDAPHIDAPQLGNPPWITPPRIADTNINFPDYTPPVQVDFREGGDLYRALVHQYYDPQKTELDRQKSLDSESLLSKIADRGLAGSGASLGMEERLVENPYRAANERALLQSVTQAVPTYNQFDYQRAKDEADFRKAADEFNFNTAFQKAKITQGNAEANAGLAMQASVANAQAALTRELTNAQMQMQAAVQNGDWQQAGRLALFQGQLQQMLQGAQIYAQTQQYDKGSLTNLLQLGMQDLNQQNSLWQNLLSLMLSDRQSRDALLANIGRFSDSRQTQDQSSTSFGTDIVF